MAIYRVMNDGSEQLQASGVYNWGISYLVVPIHTGDLPLPAADGEIKWVQPSGVLVVGSGTSWVKTAQVTL